MTNVELLQLAIRLRYGGTLTLAQKDTLPKMSKKQLVSCVEAMAESTNIFCDAVMDLLQRLDHISDAEIEIRMAEFHQNATEFIRKEHRKATKK